MGYASQSQKISISPVDGAGKICVPIVVTPYKGGVPGMAVLLQSIAENATEKYFYDIIALHNREVTEQEQIKVLEIFDAKQNFCIRFFDIHDYIIQNEFFCRKLKQRNSYVATFYRLLIPELLYEYEKVVYLDIDTIAVTDVGRMMEYDISNFMISAVRDIIGNRCYYSKDGVVKEYRDNVLKLANPDNYFNAGVLIINIKAFRQKYSWEEWWQFVSSYSWKSHDQDVLNAVCNQAVLLLPYSWNFVEAGEIVKELSVEDGEEILKAQKEPFVIHYSGRYKPWSYCTVLFFETFWNYARRNPFFEDLFNMIGDDQLINKAINKAENGTLSIKVISTLFLKWLKYNWKRVF